VEVDRILADGAIYVTNAEEELDRKILREEQLYFIDNQVEAIDTFLADTEEVNDDGEVRALRDQLRTMKGKLERKAAEFLAKQDGEELPPEGEDELPPAEMAEALVAYGNDFIGVAEKALTKKVSKIEDVEKWEAPLATLNSFLADSELVAAEHPDLPKVRQEVRARKLELRKRIDDMIQDWRTRDVTAKE